MKMGGRWVHWVGADRPKIRSGCPAVKCATPPKMGSGWVMAETNPKSVIFPYKTSRNQMHIFALFMLVSALMGIETMQSAYAHAIRQGYRFYSYGDASLLLP